MGFYFMILVVMNLIFHFMGNKWQKKKKEREKRKLCVALINQVK